MQRQLRASFVGYPSRKRPVRGCSPVPRQYPMQYPERAPTSRSKPDGPEPERAVTPSLRSRLQVAICNP